MLKIKININIFINVIAIDIVYICNGDVSWVQSLFEIHINTENVLPTKNNGINHKIINGGCYVYCVFDGDVVFTHGC